MSWRQKIRDLEEQIAKRDNIIKEQAEQIHLLEVHVKTLENVMRQYHNENTPSSQIPQYKKRSPDRATKSNQKLGKPKGSIGRTRLTPNITEEKVIRFSLEKEEYYGLPVDYKTKIIGDIAPISPISWTRYYFGVYKDPQTGDLLTARDSKCPEHGMFGPHLRSMIVMLRERANLSEGQTSEFLKTLYGLDNIAPATIEAELQRTATLLAPFYDAIGEHMGSAPIKHSDETGQSVNGENWTLYAFSTNQHTYFFADSKKRAKHLKQRLKKPWENVLVCDGHSIYVWYYAMQRCWSHAIRKDCWLLDQKQTKERMLLHEAISGTVSLTKEYLDAGPPGPEQLWNVMLMRNRLKHAIRYDWKDEKCKKVANYMENGFDSWFLFMLIPGVPHTNNLNERDIRKHVMKRKISGTFRSQQGLINHCIILSIFETWRKQRKNLYTTLIETIKNHNYSSLSVVA